jgi:hypothetical protein
MGAGRFRVGLNYSIVSQQEDWLHPGLARWDLTLRVHDGDWQITF